MFSNLGKKYKVKPSENQKNTFNHIKRGLQLKDAMIAGGYTKKTAKSPKQNFMERRGTQKLLEKYRNLLIKNGVSLDMLSEIQVEGLFDGNAITRLLYVKETKKDLGFTQDNPSRNTQINIKVVTEE